MAEFKLPANSMIGTGKSYRDTSDGKLRAVRIYRWNPDSGDNPSIDTYEVDMAACGPDDVGCVDQNKKCHRQYAYFSAFLS